MIKKFSFPVIKEERFLTESILYNQFTYDFDLYAFDDLIYVAEYMEDGYTNQGLNLFFKNPKWYLYALKQNAFCAIKYKDKFKSRLGSVARYYAWKRTVHIKDEFKNDYKLPLIYQLMGWLLSPIIYRKFKKEFKNFKNDQNTKH